MVETQLDIAFAKSVVSRFTKNLSRQYTEVVKMIMQYLKATYTFGITYGGDERDLIIKDFSNSNWADN